MKKLLIIISVLAFSHQVFGQEPAVDDIFVNKFKTNLAVPDVSAYKALEIDPSKILRPSNTKELSVIVGDLFSNGNILVPKALGVEIAPWRLASKKTLEDYRNSGTVRFLHNTSFSVAAQRDSSGSFTSKIAFGLRTSFVSKQGDFIRDTTRLKEIFRRQGVALKTRNDFLLEFLKETNTLPQQMEDSAKIAEFEEYLKDRWNEEEPLNKYIDKVVEDFKRNNWNHRRLDLALAIMGASEDTIINIAERNNNKISYETISLWSTAAFPVKKWGQLLLSLQAEYTPDRKDSLEYQISIPARFYAGTNKIKGFAEAQVTFTDINTNWFFNTGTEFSIRDGIWINLYAGITKNGSDKPAMVSHFDVRFTIPENFNLF